MKTTTKKLSLSRSTIQHLSIGSLSFVRGGIITDTEQVTERNPCDTGGGNSSLCQPTAQIGCYPTSFADTRCYTVCLPCPTGQCA
jgi:hypothetical protein